VRKKFQRLEILLLALAAGAAWARSPVRETLHFAITTNVGFGNEVFVAGNHPDTGSWDPVRGAKLTWNSGNVWTGVVGVQSGTSLDFKYVSLPNSYTGICDGGNAGWMPPGGGNHLTTNAPSQPAAPYGGKTVYYHSGLTNVTVIYSSAGGAFTAAAMSIVGPGRNGSEYLHAVSGIGEAGEGIEFVLSGMSGTNTVYDHAPHEGYGTPPDNNYFTKLDVFFLQDGDVFNYRPPAAPSTPRIHTSTVVSTHEPSPNRTMKVYLPRGYDQNPWKRYPVVYMHDGENVFSPGVGLSGYGWVADLTATREISQGRMRECIIVGLNSTANRTREYLPPEDNYSGQGFGDVYAKFIEYDVKPQIDGAYRTLTNRANTGTIGSSSGGLITTYLGWATNVFGFIGPFSPAYLISPNFNQTIDTKPKQPLRIFTQTGTVGSPEIDILPDTWTVLDYFLKDGFVPNVDLVSRIGCGQAHSEQSWADWLPECFRFLLDPWDEPNRLAQAGYPPVLAAPTGAATGVLAADYPSLLGHAYRVETATNPAAQWVATATSSVEQLPWAIRSMAVTNGALPGETRHYRLSAFVP
jgi:predicted alpha/beta superfamily hydrolase